MLFGPPRTGSALPRAAYRVGGLSEDVTLTFVILNVCLRGAAARHRVVGDGEVVEVLSGQHAGAAGAADRRVHKGVGKGRAFIRKECFGLVQRLTER